MKKVMLFYPPGRMYQRGEDRSQGNIDDSTATAIRACNDLGYVAAGLLQHQHRVFLRDYQSEKATMQDLLDDFTSFEPDLIFVSITNATIFQDLQIIHTLKARHPGLVVVLKGAIFFDPDPGLFDFLDLGEIDCLVGGECEFIMPDLVDALFHDREKLRDIKGIVYKENGRWHKTDFASWYNDLDGLPFPARDLMNNALYVRPDTGEPQATIATSRGCPSSCIFCLTPMITGKRLRLRSPDNILKELQECYHRHNIRNFFFKSDTFTINKRWTMELCQAIVDSELKGKIHWVANSRVRPIDVETLALMKKAGCWLVAFGYESGSEETLRLIKKQTTLEDNIQASRYAKEVGLKTFGFFLIGFPWEDWEDLRATERLIFRVQPDFLELHIAVPYPGTELYDIARAEKLIDESVLGKDYFNAPTKGTKHLTMDEIEAFQRKVILRYHLQPGYIFRKLVDAMSHPKVLWNYGRYGVRLIRANLASR